MAWTPKTTKSAWQMTEEERQAWREERQREADRMRAEAEASHWNEVHGCLAACMDLALRAGLPTQNILLFSVTTYPFTVVYDGEQLVRLSSLWEGAKQSARIGRVSDCFYEYLQRRCAEIPEYPYGVATFGLVWFDSLDHAESCIGMRLPWITLGYWRRAEPEAEKSEGRFYRLWLISEKEPEPNKEKQP
jgi:hypothetical protein